MSRNKRGYLHDGTCGLQGSRLPRGFMLRACLCGVRARVNAGSCREANMTLSDCLCHACLCLCCMRARVCADSGNGAKPPPGSSLPLSSLAGPSRTSGMIVCRGSLSGDLTVASCMTPKVRSLDGVVCVLLCVGLNPCRLHVVLLS